MRLKPRLNESEQALCLELFDTLASARDVPQMFEQASPLLLRLFPSEALALCISRPDPAAPYDWMPVNAPTSFYERYEEVAGDDFVRAFVTSSPNEVMRDSEMMSRAELKRSRLYEYCRKTGMPADHVMAVMLDVHEDWHGGLTLYREGRLPFSDHERALLQWITPTLAGTIRNLRLLGEQRARGELLDSFLKQREAEFVIVDASAKEVDRTSGATAMLQRWFSSGECTPAGLPHEFLERLSVLSRQNPLEATHADVWERERQGADRFLNVVFVPLPARSAWALVLREIPNLVPLPDAWRSLLTKSQAEVASGMIQAWDNQTIASHFPRAEGTVKKHVNKIYDRLGVETREAVVHQAVLMRRKRQL